jgi:hypothetical protein
MNGGAYSLARLRRSSSGAARYVVGLFVVAYLSVGVAPCAMAASEAVQADRAVSHELEHAHEHEPRVAVAHSQHAHEHHAAEAGEHAPTSPTDSGTAYCPHCLAGTASTHAADHSSCLALPDSTNAAAHAKDAPPQLAPALGPRAFTLPPPLAAPRARPPSRRVSVPPVPLNIRNCVFLI